MHRISKRKLTEQIRKERFENLTGTRHIEGKRDTGRKRAANPMKLYEWTAKQERES